MLFRLTFALFLVVSLSFPISAPASQIDEDQAGAWYMYFFNKDFSQSRFGFQGDIQHRNWDMGGDLEQLLVRGGLTYRPEALAGKYTLGVANITSGQLGRSDKTTSETRIYQEVLIPQQLGSRVFLRHRVRFEQRWVEDQDFRTRFRYGLFADVPLNQPTLSEGLGGTGAIHYVVAFKNWASMAEFGDAMAVSEEFRFLQAAAAGSVTPVASIQGEPVYYTGR